MRLSIAFCLLLLPAAASAQQANPAQQAAYAKALQGTWFTGGGSDLNLVNDGAEVRATYVRPSQGMVAAGAKAGQQALSARFTGPEMRGQVLNGTSERYRQLCNVTNFWRPFRGKVTFERNRVDITYSPVIVYLDPKTRKCASIGKEVDPRRFEEIRANHGLQSVVIDTEVTTLTKR